MTERRVGARPLVVVTSRAHEDALALLKQDFDVDAHDADEPLRPDELAERAAKASGLLVFMPDRIDAALLRRCPQLRVVAGALRGADNIDVDACTARGVRVTVVPDLLSGPTAELALALLLAAARRVREGDALVRAGRFEGWRPGMHGLHLAGAPVGVVGAGALGREIVKLLAAIGARVSYHDPAVAGLDGFDSLSLRSLMSESRAVVLALPLTRSTRGLVDETTLALMPHGAVLVNVGRGSTVDELAVADALESGRLAAYAADVFAFEDASAPERPRAIEPRLLAHPRSVFTPHIGSAVAETRRAVEMHAARAIRAVLEGDSPEGTINLPPLPER